MAPLGTRGTWLTKNQNIFFEPRYLRCVTRPWYSTSRHPRALGTKKYLAPVPDQTEKLDKNKKE